MQKGSKMGFGASLGAGPKKGGRAEADFGGKEYLLLSNVGLQGGIIFSSKEDYDRFEAYLYLLNAIESPRASNFFLDGRKQSVYDAARGENLVAIGAYSFTPKEFYILATPLVPQGVAKFMQKLQTAYTMYFNLKYQRSGRIFHSSYRKEMAESDAHLKYLLAQTHMYPAVLFDTRWEDADQIELRTLAHNAAKYRYSSVGEYSEKRFVITAPQYFPSYFKKAKDPDAMLKLWKQNKTTGKSN